jgi:hypothetical protein
MTLSRYAALKNELGWRDFSIRMLRAAGVRIYRREFFRLFSYRLAQYPFRLPHGYDLDLRRITYSEAEKLVDPQIAIPASVLADRKRQGARMYGALWQGRIIDYCWCAGAPGFRETTKGFKIDLRPGELYIFDYKGIIKGRPTAFSSFRLMKAMNHYTTNKEALRIATDAHFISLVSEQNRVALAFHKRFLNAKTVDRVTLYRLLGKCWSQREQKC